MRQETDGVLLESYLIYEPEHQSTWYKDGKALLGALDFEEKYQVSAALEWATPTRIDDTFSIVVTSSWRPAALLGAAGRLDLLRPGHPAPVSGGRRQLHRDGQEPVRREEQPRPAVDEGPERAPEVRHEKQSGLIAFFVPFDALSLRPCVLLRRVPGGIEPTFFRKPSSRQEGNKLHLECEIEALPKPEIKWFRGDTEITERPGKYSLYRGIQQSNPNIHFVRLTIQVNQVHH